MRLHSKPNHQFVIFSFIVVLLYWSSYLRNDEIILRPKERREIINKNTLVTMFASKESSSALKESPTSTRAMRNTRRKKEENPFPKGTGTGPEFFNEEDDDLLNDIEVEEKDEVIDQTEVLDKTLDDDSLFSRKPRMTRSPILRKQFSFQTTFSPTLDFMRRRGSIPASTKRLPNRAPLELTETNPLNPQVATKSPTPMRKPQQILASSPKKGYFPETYEPGKKYFFYQPSGGWGNQRYILRWAILAANAMNRTLAVAPLAPHSDIWTGYNQWKKEHLLPANKVLDVRALTEAVNQGVVFLDDIPSRVIQRAMDESSLSVKIHVKGHYVDRTATKKKWLIYKESYIRDTWGNDLEDIIFWDKMSMWICCATDFGPDQVWYGRHIMFNRKFKLFVKKLTENIIPYNAIHVRRGDMTISKDRKTADIYFKVHHLEKFDLDLPLYVATNEPDRVWFEPLKSLDRFKKLVFWSDLDQNSLQTFLKDFPTSMKGDVSGFIDQLICGNAVKWEGSQKSTFSDAITTIRAAPQLREIDWSFPLKPSIRKGLSSEPIVILTSNQDETEDELTSFDQSVTGGEAIEQAQEEPGEEISEPKVEDSTIPTKELPTEENTETVALNVNEEVESIASNDNEETEAAASSVNEEAKAISSNINAEAESVSSNVNEETENQEELTAGEHEDLAQLEKISEN